MPATILIPILQYGIPAGLKGLDFLMAMIERLRNNPNQTQDEFNADWEANKAQYVADGHTWDEAGQSPAAKA